jgi:preprotein translocase subunit SecF
VNIVGRRNWYFLLSLAIILPGIISMAVFGFRLGIDFQGGDQYNLAFKQPVQAAAVQKEMDTFNVEATVQQAGSNGVLITTKPVSPAQDSTIRADLAKKFPVDFTKSSFAEVGPTIARELVVGAGGLIAIASILIVIYLSFRFNYKFAVCAILALLHDVFVLTGIYSILGKVFNLPLGEINTLFVTAVLTVIGFSVHDTIVIFDRIRENLRQASRLTFEQNVNLSIIQSLARSLNTSMTVVFVLVALFLISPQNIKGFTLALLIGIVSGTYSSIFNASPLLVVWRRLDPR